MPNELLRDEVNHVHTRHIRHRYRQRYRRYLGTGFFAALRCPELDVKLVTTDRGRPEYRAKLCCQVLAAGGRQDLPIGLGLGW